MGHLGWPSPQLELGDNKLTGALERLGQCPSLVHVSLVGNRIASVDDLQPLVGGVSCNRSYPYDCGPLSLERLVVIDVPRPPGLPCDTAAGLQREGVWVTAVPHRPGWADEGGGGGGRQ